MGLFVRRKGDGGVLVSRSADFESPPPDEHRFATKWVSRNLTTGLISVGGGQITIHTGDEGDDVVYDIDREPGAYCVHCGDRLGDGPATTPEEAARRVAYVEECEIASNDDDTGDPRFGLGIEVADYYRGVLADA